MSDVDDINFFTGSELLVDPYPYFEALRAEGPIRRETHYDVLMVTGYDEALRIYNDVDSFSSCTAVTGPFPGFPVPLAGRSREEVDALILEHRGSLPMNDQLPTLDPPVHTDHRAVLLMRLITPKRLKENEEFIYRLTDRTLDTFLGRGECEYNGEFAAPLAMLVVADLLGVPEDDHERFRQALLGGHGPDRKTTGTIGSTGGDHIKLNPLEFLYQRFSEYIEDRRADPRDDVLTGLAQATFPDGSTPDVIDVVRVAANLFAAGQETTVRLLSSGVMIMAEDPGLQAELPRRPGADPQLRRGDAAPREPGEGRLPPRSLPGGDRRRHDHRGRHRDAGQRGDQPRPAPLRTAERLRRPPRQRPPARVVRSRRPHLPRRAARPREARIGFQRLLERTSDIRISEQHHGPAGNRDYRYVPTFILRGLTHLFIEFDPAEG